MKIQVRRGVFETNSSSVHSLQIYSSEIWNQFAFNNALMEGDTYELCNMESVQQKYEKYVKHNKDNGLACKSFEDWKKDRFWSMEDLHAYCYNNDYDIMTEDTPDDKWTILSISGSNY